MSIRFVLYILDVLFGFGAVRSGVKAPIAAVFSGIGRRCGRVYAVCAATRVNVLVIYEQLVLLLLDLARVFVAVVAAHVRIDTVLHVVEDSVVRRRFAVRLALVRMLIGVVVLIVVIVMSAA